jgi:hypothetical protein
MGNLTRDRIISLHDRCGQLFTDNSRLAAGSRMALLPPDGGEPWLIVRESTEFGLYPLPRNGRGSVVYPEGTFQQLGDVTLETAERVTAGYVPAPKESYSSQVEW